MGKAEQMAQGKKIAKAGKILLFVLLIAVSLFFISCVISVASWSGAFNFMFPKEVATYNSPDGEYSLIFEQMGDPHWPFGPADVRFTLKNSNGKTIKRISTQIHDDGLGASERHIQSISWNDEAVSIILQASEMPDKEISIPYIKR